MPKRISKETPTKHAANTLNVLRAFALLIAGCITLLVVGMNEEQRSQARLTETSLSQSYKLAYEQSFGFFDDITDENWKRMQTIAAHTFPNHQNLYKHSNGPDDFGKYDKLAISKNWNAANFQEEFHCTFARRLPDNSDPDGPKWVCDPHRVAKQEKCIVYSVGSNGNVMFEKAVKDEISPHCEIHTFDMNTYNKRNGNFAEALKGYATFHNYGIGTEEQSKQYRETGKGVPYKTIQETMQELGHDRVDIFKIDCEWCEWFTFRDWLKAGDLRQILVETHNAPMPNARDFFYTLHDAGYVIFSKEANFMNAGGGVEFGFLKLKTDFFVNNTLYKNLPSGAIVK